MDPIWLILFMCICSGVNGAKGHHSLLDWIEGQQNNSNKESKSAGRQSGAPGTGSRYIRRPNHNKPRLKTEDKLVLLEEMADDYQPLWMSIEDPSDQKGQASFTTNEVTVEDLTERWAADRLFQQLQQLNLSAELFSEPELKHNVKVQMAIKSWLLRRASCPIEFSWQDLGVQFFPRYARKGNCVNMQGTCSWPPGMHCVPAGRITAYFRRWVCEKKKRRTRIEKKEKKAEQKGFVVPVLGAPRGNGRKGLGESIGGGGAKKRKQKKKCNWYRVPYPITIECFCTC